MRARGPTPPSAGNTASTFDDALSPRAAQAITVQVPLQRVEAEVIAANPKSLDRAGIHLPSGVLSRGGAAEIAQRFGVDRAEAETPTLVGLATRYHDWWHGEEYGSVRGDGRAVLLSDAIVRDERGRVVGLEEQQVKGVPTGLTPVGVDANDAHGNGREQLRVALKDAVFKDYLIRSGIRSNGWVAVLKTPQDFVYGAHSKAGGLLVRSGNFLRLAHLNFLRDDPKSLREAIDQINRLLSVELGRARPLSLGGLFRLLASRKAEELAGLYWARVFHQSTTYDNIGIFEVVDHGSMGTVDRAHPRSWSSTSPGFTSEGREIMEDLYAGELLELFRRAATDDERAELPTRQGATRLVKAKLEERMTEGALAHLGLDPDDVALLLRHHRPEVQVLVQTLREVGETAESGATYALGSQHTDVQDPARYDIFAALSVLAELKTSGLSQEEQERQLILALAPLSADAARDRKAASALLSAAAPVLRAALAGHSGAIRTAKAGLIAAEAGRINASVLALDRDTVLAFTTDLADGLENKRVDRIRVQAEMLALVRANVRTGESSPPAIAMRLRHGQIAPREGEFLMIKGELENGVRLEEWSDGSDDGLRVTVESNPLALADPSRYRLRLRWPDGREEDRAPPRVDGDQPIFPLRLDVLRSGATLSIIDADDPARRWDNGGLGFGRGWQLALDAPLVRAELARYAKAHGRSRADTTEAAQKAVRGHAESAPRRRSTPKSLRQIQTPLDVRLAYTKGPPR